MTLLRRPLALEAKILMFGGLLAIAAAVVYWTLVRELVVEPASVDLPWWVVAAGFAAAQRCVIHLHSRRGTHPLVVAELPLVFGLAFLGPTELVLAGLLGSSLALLLDRQIPLARAFFDSAPFTLGTCAALLVLDAFGVGRDPLEPAVWLAVFGAVSASTLVAGACVGIADGLGARAVRRPLDTLVGNWLLALGSTSLGLAAAAVVTASPVAGMLLVPPTAALLLANRAYVRERRRSAELGVLYDAARALSRSSGTRPELDELLERTADLERAVSDHELTVVYQPVVGLEDGRPVALEALVRWNHPERGLVPPGDFIALAEETGVVVQIGKIVLERVAEQAARVGIPIHVNVSAPELTAPGFLGRVDELVARHGLTPDLLVFEVTERLFVAGDPALVAVLEGLKERGMRVAMDDFGTGYSSLACLPRLPVDTMKIPKEITDEVTGGHEHPSLARAVVELGAALNLTVVAEGIEHPDQITALRAFGCDYGQGYFYGRPTDAQVALSRVDLLREAAAA